MAIGLLFIFSVKTKCQKLLKAIFLVSDVCLLTICLTFFWSESVYINNTYRYIIVELNKQQTRNIYYCDRSKITRTTKTAQPSRENYSGI